MNVTARRNQSPFLGHWGAATALLRLANSRETSPAMVWKSLLSGMNFSRPFSSGFLVCHAALQGFLKHLQWKHSIPHCSRDTGLGSNCFRGETMKSIYFPDSSSTFFPSCLMAADLNQSWRGNVDDYELEGHGVWNPEPSHTKRTISIQ